MKQRAARVQGFTLIEVMLAVVILALIGLASTAVLSQMTQAERHSVQHHALLAELQFTLLLLDNDVRQMVARPVRASDEQHKHLYVSNNGRLLESDYDGLAFVRAGWLNPEGMLPRAELQPVVYRVQEGVLQRVYQPFVDAIGGTPAVQNLLTEVEDFQVTFFHQGKELKTWLQAYDLPEQVQIKITHARFGVIERVLLTSGVQVPSEAS